MLKYTSESGFETGDLTMAEQAVVDTMRRWNETETDRDKLALELSWHEVRSLGTQYLHSPATVAKDVAAGEITEEEGRLWDAFLQLFELEKAKAYSRIQKLETSAEANGKSVVTILG